MSNPINPLSQYNSYAYHHILLACDSTKTAEALAKTNEFLAFARNPEDVNTPSDPYGKYAAKDINLGKGRVGKYNVIIDGTKDASFVITKANWFSTTANSASNDNHFETMTVEGGMTVQEPRGVDFMNVMAKTADFLDSNPSGLVFMLKTIFVGHRSKTASINSEIDPITNVRPIFFIIYDITANFTIQGGVYDVKFMGLNHGASKTRHIMKGADRVSIDLSKADDECEADTLMGGLCKLQTLINEEYNRYYEDIQQEIKESTDSKGNPLKFNGRKVTYIIQAEEPYIDVGASTFSDDPLKVKLKGNTEYVIDQFPDQSKNKGVEGEAGQMHFGKEPSIESCIIRMAKRCSKVQRDLKEGDTVKGSGLIKFTPKVATTIVSDDKNYYVIYHLRRVMESRNNIIERVLKRRSDDPNKLSKDILKNLLTLDYFFSGKNTDILNFDIKMEMGLAFFQSLATTDNIANSATQASGGMVENSDKAEGAPLTNKQTPEDDPEKLPNLRTKTPIFFSTKFDSKLLRNTLSPEDSATFQALLNRHAALENLEAVVEIHGNPGLLNTTNKPPSEIFKQKSKNETLSNDGDDQPDVFPYWETTPAIVQINIRMPTTENDPPYTRADATKPFWYQGYYYCFGLEHIFNEGLFTQKLNLISLPAPSPRDETKNKQKSKADAKSQKEKQQNETSQKSSVPSTSISASDSSNQSQQKITKTVNQRAEDTPPPAETSPDNMSADDYLKALYKGGRSVC